MQADTAGAAESEYVDDAIWREAHVSALWRSTVAHREKMAEPAHIWRWRQMEPLIDRAIEATGMAAAERRVLNLANPCFSSGDTTTRNLTGGLQVLLPGEAARPHRHSMNALRFVMQGSGAVTVVDGRRCAMEEGDFLLTPGGCWHEHRHEGQGRIVWFDALDVPLHRHLGTADFQHGPAPARPEMPGDEVCVVPNVVPEGLPPADHSPVFRYPWAWVKQALQFAPFAADGSRRVRYVNPLTGGPVMSLIDCSVMELEPGRPTLPVRSSAESIAVVVEGEGRSRIGDDVLEWREKDILTLPKGVWITHDAAARSRLFLVSDREILRRLDLLSEEIDGKTAGTNGGEVQ